MACKKCGSNNNLNTINKKEKVVKDVYKNEVLTNTPLKRFLLKSGLLLLSLTPFCNLFVMVIISKFIKISKKEYNENKS